MPLQDVNVTIDVNYPSPKVGLGRPLILTKGTEATYKEYLSLTALEKDFAEDTDAYKKAKVLLKQKNRPDVVAVTTYAEGELDKAMEKYFKKGWHFCLLADDNQADQLTISIVIEEKDFKFFAAQVTDEAGREVLKGQKRTLIFQHHKPEEHLDAAAVGSLSSLDVGSITWKFKGGFVGVTAQEIDEDELLEIEADYTMVYLMKSGKAQLSDGIEAGGEYIDVLHGKDFVKVDMENEIQYAMQNADKVPYDQRGIGLIGSAATTSLQRAGSQGIIALKEDDSGYDYTIVMLSRNEVTPQDRAARVYNGLSFEFELAGAIHEANVKGLINI